MAHQNSSDGIRKKSRTTGMPVTPSPTKDFKPFGRNIDRPRKDQQPSTGYGANQWSGPSSLLPGQRVNADFDIGPKGTDDGEQALEAVIRGEHNQAPNGYQVRHVSAEPYPTKEGMRSRSGEGGTVPTTNMRRPTISGR